jgi:hypothetical protein
VITFRRADKIARKDLTVNAKSQPSAGIDRARRYRQNGQVSQMKVRLSALLSNDLLGGIHRHTASNITTHLFFGSGRSIDTCFRYSS